MFCTNIIVLALGVTLCIATPDIKNDPYKEIHLIFDKDMELYQRFKRAVNDDNQTQNIANTEATTNDNITEECIGSQEYCNLTEEEYVRMLNDYIYPNTYEWILIGTHTIVFIIGLVGNALVCVAVYRNHSMRTVTNYFIVNLAAADFMVIMFCLPPTVLWDVTETWFFGSAMCKVILYFQVSFFYLYIMLKKVTIPGTKYCVMSIIILFCMKM